MLFPKKWVLGVKELREGEGEKEKDRREAVLLHAPLPCNYACVFLLGYSSANREEEMNLHSLSRTVRVKIEKEKRQK